MRIAINFIKYLKKIKIIIIFIFFSGVLYFLNTEPLYLPTAMPQQPDFVNLPSIITTYSNRFLKTTSAKTHATENFFNSSHNTPCIEINLSIKNNKLVLAKENENMENENMDFFNQDTNMDLEKLVDLIDINKYMVFNLKLKDILIFNQQPVKHLVDFIKERHLEDRVFIKTDNLWFLIYLRLKARDIMVILPCIYNKNQIWLLKKFNNFYQKQVRRIIRPDLLLLNMDYLTHNSNTLQQINKQRYPIFLQLEYRHINQKSINKIKKHMEYDCLAGIFIDGKDFFKTKYFLENFFLMNKNFFLTDGGKNLIQVKKIVHVSNFNHIMENFIFNYNNKVKTGLLCFGTRHSCQKNCLNSSGVALNMLSFNKIFYNKTNKNVHIQAGATWHQVIQLLNKFDRSLDILPSLQTSSVGGSLSSKRFFYLRRHNLQSLSFLWPSGRVQKLYFNRIRDKILLDLILSGYGLFGIILEVEMRTIPNNFLKIQSKACHNIYLNYLLYIRCNPKIYNAYFTLSIDKKNLFTHKWMVWFEKTQANLYNSTTSHLQGENLIAIKRALFRFSEIFDMGKKFKWIMGTYYSNSRKKNITFNQILNTDIHTVWPIYKKYDNIIQIYCIPCCEIDNFLYFFKKLLQKFHINIFEISIKPANIYSRNNFFVIHCWFSVVKNHTQQKDNLENFFYESNRLVLNLNGSFNFTHSDQYNTSMLFKNFINLRQWLFLKKLYDKNLTFNSDFYKHMQTKIKIAKA